MKNIYIKIINYLFIILAFCACDSKNPLDQELIKMPMRNVFNENFNFDKKKLAFPKCIKINDSVSIDFYENNYQNQNRFRVNSKRNKIKKHNSKFFFVASDSVGLTSIFYPTGTDEVEQIDSVHIFVYKQFVILKADDLIFNNASIVSLNWHNFIDYMFEKNIVASLGILGNSLEAGNSKYYNFLKDLIKSNYFEIWNHGYKHIVDAINEYGTVYSEFKNTNYDNQFYALNRTEFLCNKYLGYTPITFGAPGNAIDEITNDVINNTNDIKIWFFGNKNSSKMILERKSEIEFPYGFPDYQKFLNNYLPNDSVLTFQLHPNMWDSLKFDEFKKCLEYLESQNVTFITPNEYYFLNQPR